MNENKREVKISFSHTDIDGNVTKLNKVYTEEASENLDTECAYWFVDEFKQFLLAMGFASGTVERIVQLEHGEKIVGTTGKIYDPTEV